MIDLTNSLLDLSSAFIVIIAAILLYFGKVIADTKVEKYEKTDLIISGLFFTLIFILFSVALNIFFYQKGWILLIAPWVIVLFHLVLMGIYAGYNIYKDIKKYELDDEYRRRFNKKIENLKKNKIVSKFVNQKSDLLKQSLNLFDIIFRFFENGKVLLFFSIAIFYSIMLIANNGTILLITTVAILSFINLSLIAIAHGLSTAYYPPSKITMTNGKTIEGKALKFGEFIYIIKKDKKYFINKDQIKIIEQDKIKKKK